MTSVDPIAYAAKVAENNAYIEWYYQNVYIKHKKQADSLAAAKESSSNWKRQWLEIQAEKDPEYTVTINRMADKTTSQWQQIHKEKMLLDKIAIKFE